MYDRKAKNIADHAWSDLMKEPSTAEIRETINKIPKDKASGYDEVDINLIKLLIEEEKDCPDRYTSETVRNSIQRRCNTSILEEICDHYDPQKKRRRVMDR